MEEKKLYNEEEIKKFHIPRWNEIPSVDLYIDQVVSLLEANLSNYITSTNEKPDKVITKSMINNYVKHGVISPPIAKKYKREHIAYLFVIFILKQIYSIEEIKQLLDLAIHTSPADQSYTRFCSELEKAIKMTFTGENYINNARLSQEQYLLRNVVQSFANKLYVQKVFLKIE